MRSLTKTLALLSLSLAALAPATRAGIVELPQYGFEIDMLDAAVPADGVATPLMTFLPAADGLAPNLNVQLQPFPGTISSYVETSKKEFAGMNITVIKDELRGDNEWVAEYQGNLQGKDLRFYSRAILRNGRIYLITSTAGQSQWPTIGDTLKAHVESFKLK